MSVPMTSPHTRVFSTFLLALVASVFVGPLPGQSGLPVYVKTPALSGSLRITGSDAHMDLARLWSEKFKSYYPAVAVQVEGGGSRRGAAALVRREAEFGLLARPLSDEEKAQLTDRLPQLVQLQTCLDVLAIFVHKENPLTGLSFVQLERAFAARPRSGSPARTWGDLGATGPFAAQPLTMLGRTPDSGAYALFKKAVLGGNDFRAEVVENVGPASVVRAVADGKGALGYAQLRTRSNRTRVLSLGTTQDSLIEPTPENCISGNYPLVHSVYLCTERTTDPEQQRLRTEFLRFVLSREGQEIAQALGLLPLSASQAEKESANLR